MAKEKYESVKKEFIELLAQNGVQPEYGFQIKGDRIGLVYYYCFHSTNDGHWTTEGMEDIAAKIRKYGITPNGMKVKHL